MKIISKTKIHYGLYGKFDQISLKYIPMWFEFLNWIILLGIFYFLNTQLKNNWTLIIIFTISILGLWKFLQSYIYIILSREVNFIKNDFYKKFFSWVMAIILSGLIYGWLINLIPQINDKI